MRYTTDLRVYRRGGAISVGYMTVLLAFLGPEDEFEDEVNGDPDSLWGEDEADDEYDEFSGEDEEWLEEELDEEEEEEV